MFSSFSLSSNTADMEIQHQEVPKFLYKYVKE